MNIQSNLVNKGADVLSTSVVGDAVGAFISTHQPRWKWATLARDGTAFSAYGTLVTKPSTNVIYEGSVEYPTLIRVMPFTGTSTIVAAGVRVVGWSMYLDGSTEVWLPTVLADVALTRTSGTTVKTTLSSVDWYPFAGMTVTGGTPAPNGYALGNTATNPPASILVDVLGSQLVQVTCFAASGDFGCMWATL
jgi:hypothetical protein